MLDGISTIQDDRRHLSSQAVDSCEVDVDVSGFYNDLVMRMQVRSKIHCGSATTLRKAVLPSQDGSVTGRAWSGPSPERTSR